VVDPVVVVLVGGAVLPVVHAVLLLDEVEDEVEHVHFGELAEVHAELLADLEDVVVLEVCVRRGYSGS